MAGSQKTRLIVAVFAALICTFAAFNNNAQAQKHGIDEMSLERWSKLREVERHQMQIAEKYYREKNWKVAAAEYDKYLNLYEASESASHALLKWSLCNVQLRKQNTAIDDGFRSVIDYWPDSEDAIAAGYYIGKTLKDIGQTKKAKPALKKCAEDHAKHPAGVFSMVALAEIAAIEKDDEGKVTAWKKLTFDAPRTRRTKNYCVDASVRLASHFFLEGDLPHAVEALATTYEKKNLSEQVVQRASNSLQTLVSKEESKSKGYRLADQLIVFLKEQLPEDTTSEETEAEAKRIWYLIADVNRNAKRREQVRDVFQQIGKIFGGDDELRGKIGQWHEAGEEYDAARKVYRSFDDKVEGMLRTARTYRTEKDLANAVATYGRLTSEDAENSTRWQAETASTYREFRKYQEAVGVYQGLVQKDVSNSDKWLWEIASTYRDASKWKEAIGFYRQTDRFPSNYQEMAGCHRRLKQWDEAVVLYKQIAGGHKGLAPWAMLQIGYTNEQAGKKDRAIASFKQVCKQFPKDRHASVAHAHLQNKYKLSVTLGGAKDE